MIKGYSQNGFVEATAEFFFQENASVGYSQNGFVEATAEFFSRKMPV